jgi:hypothetical protein
VNHGLEGAIRCFGAGQGGHCYLNRRTTNADAIKNWLDRHRETHVPFYRRGIPEWPALCKELSELRKPTMEMEEGQAKYRLEDKETWRRR